MELDFESQDRAEGMLAKLQENVWSSPDAAPALSGSPKTRIVEVVG